MSCLPWNQLKHGLCYEEEKSISILENQVKKLIISALLDIYSDYILFFEKFCIRLFIK